ncbi:MAG TPA: hypothetical protein VJQ44_06490 [Gemmatimonadales bacterium]|nr:hypothetical protein [Gemmatimonadales bacterium]
MYLVELRPGKEELYRSGDELAAAIRSGDVDGHSRIYHRATSKWISITLHPQYKAIVAERPAPAQPAADRNNWTYLNAQSETLEGAAPDEGAGELPSRDRLHPWRRSMALSITGLLLVLGIQVSFSGPRPPWTAKPVPVSIKPVSAPAPASTSHVVSLASTTWEAPAAAPAEQPAAPAAAAPLLPKAPKLRPKTLASLAASTGSKDAEAGTVDGLISGYESAYDSARGRLEAGMRVTRLDQLFAPARLMPNGGLTETRLGLAGAANFIRVYRQQEASIERQFQDSFTVMARDQKWSTKVARRWYSRPALKEPTALAAMTTTLVATVDSVLDVLDDQAGAYYFTEAGIRFEDAGATRRYGELRRHLTSLLEQTRNAGGAEAGTPMAHLLQAVGTTQLPQEL